ncbi:ISAs1 family transposase, partial [Sphingobacteriales bacterium UPWRP_1]
CLSEDGQHLIESVQDKLIHFDGKKIRGASSKGGGNNHGLYILSAWVSDYRLCIGQQKVGNKSNEITAIPELIATLDLRGSIVTIDAMGCQSNIAGKLTDAGADYILAVKENQRGLYEEVSAPHLWSGAPLFDETWEYDHGRYEVRTCRLVSASECLSPALLANWSKIKTIIKITAKRTVGELTSTQSRYYISSTGKEAAFYNAAVREHWSIENHLHWHLDVTFNEDGNRSRAGNAPQNLNILRKMALHRISRMKDKLSLKKRRFRASMNLDYLQKIIDF